MKIQVRWCVLAVAVAGALWLVGCGQRQGESSSPPATSQQPTAQQSAPAGETVEEAGSGEKITPAGTVGGIWDQITQEQNKLSATIENGQLKEVHHLAFGIRDLVVALADKASAETPSVAPGLKTLVGQVSASADKLDRLGDAGNLSGTQAEFEHLKELLNAINTVTTRK